MKANCMRANISTSIRIGFRLEIKAIPLAVPFWMARFWKTVIYMASYLVFALADGANFTIAGFVKLTGRRPLQFYLGGRIFFDFDIGERT